MGRHHTHNAPRCGTHPGSKRWLSNDCCGWVCAILTWVFLGFASYVVYVTLLRPWKGIPLSVDAPLDASGWVHYVGFFGCIFLAYWSHLKTMLTDPGAVPPEAIPLDYYNGPSSTGQMQEHHQVCRHCDYYKPQIAHHCSICSRCIVRMDHHCVWSNNCIGQTNHKFFLLFVFYTFLACCWATYLIFAKIIVCGRGYKMDGNNRSYQSLDFCSNSPIHHSLLNVLLGVEAFFFGMFTICMLCDQIAVVNAGVSHIDELKARRHRQQLSHTPVRDSLVHIFGGDGTFSLWWLIPVDAKWKNPEKEFQFMLPKGHGALKHVSNEQSSQQKDIGENSDGSDASTDITLVHGEKSPADMV